MKPDLWSEERALRRIAEAVQGYGWHRATSLGDLARGTAAAMSPLADTTVMIINRFRYRDSKRSDRIAVMRHSSGFLVHVGDRDRPLNVQACCTLVEVEAYVLELVGALVALNELRD